MNTKVYILLPVHNRKDITLKFISLLKVQDHVNYTLLLIDDGSTDGTSEAVARELSQAEVLRGKGDWWWGGSLHQGYKWLKKQAISADDIVLIMNDDTEIKSDFISKGVAALKEHKNTLLLATAHDLKTGELRDQGVCYDFKNNTIVAADKDHPVNCLSTRGLFLKATDFIALGGFHPFLLPHYISDYEFTIRAYHKGYKLISSNEVKLWFDDITTGIHDRNLKSLKWKEYWKVYFSKRYAGNPVYAINFYLLAFPFPYNIKHAFIQLKQFVKTFLHVLRRSISI